jgi:hypothetical protein
MDPEIDARDVAAGPGVERRVAFSEVVRVSLIYRRGLFIFPVGGRLRSQTEASRLQVHVEVSPHEVLEVSAPHDSVIASPECTVSRSTGRGMFRLFAYGILSSSRPNSSDQASEPHKRRLHHAAIDTPAG